MQREPRFRGRFVISLAFLVASLLLPHLSTASDLVFGPQTCQRGTGAPTVFNYSFAAPESSRGFIFKVYNGGLEDTTYELVSSSVITLNGVQILGPSNFSQNVTYVEVPVTLQAQNTLSVEVRGKPGGAIIIKGYPFVVIDTPVAGQALSATSLPVTGHLNSAATSISVNGVTGTVTGATFAVNGVPLVEGSNVLTATAVGAGGFTGQASVTVTRDTTPPAITLTIPHDGATVTVPSVDILGSVNDPSAVVLVNGFVVVLAGTSFAATSIPLQIGPNAIPIEARDPLGNRATVVLHLNYTPPMPTASLAAAPNQIQIGAASTLQWTTTATTTVSISQGIGTVAASGTQTISPTETTTYTLTATGLGGTVTAMTTVTVTYPLPSVTLSASPGTIAEGSSANLSWTATNASTCSIEPEIGTVAVSGSIDVSPAVTTTYNISCSGAGGTVITSAAVSVTYLPPTASLSAAPSSVLQGTALTLTWTTTGAQICTIDNGIGAIDCNGSTIVSPAVATTYTLSATGPGGSTTAQTTVGITYLPPSVSLNAMPTMIIPGETSTLAWTTTGADSCSIDNGIGTVPCLGSVPVSPSVSTTYTISASGPGGSAVTSQTITVTPAGVHAELEASVTSVPLGQSLTLSWSTTAADRVALEPGIGNVAAVGFLQVSPTVTTTYTLTAIGAQGIASARITVIVLGAVSPLSASSFGSQYQDLIPLDATITTYDSKRFSMVIGSVVDREGIPLAGVSAVLLGHPEYGTAHTDTAGRFALPMDGSDRMIVVLKEEGYIEAQRQVDTPWNGFANVEQVTLIPEDSVSTRVTFDGNPATVITHRSTPVTDDRGRRSVTIVFTGDNHAHAFSGDQDMGEVQSIAIRATEYQTQQSMPAKLPPTSAFTFCTELSADGLEHIVFDKPVLVYVENFLGFGVGTVVPVGFYDRQRGVWVPSENGKVVQLLDTNGDGIVDALDGNGDGIPDDLNGDGGVNDEVAGLGDPESYHPGATYWRFAARHFSPWDLNWPWRLPSGAVAPGPFPGPTVDQEHPHTDRPCNVTNSYVMSLERIFHEDIPLPGIGMSLHYASDRVPGYQILITTPVSGEAVPVSLKRIDVKLQIAGRLITRSLAPAAKQSTDFLWDGLDFMGRAVKGHTKASVAIDYIYDAFYATPSAAPLSFARSGFTFTTIPTRGELAITRTSEFVILGSRNEDNAGSVATGWTLSEQHRMEPSDTTTLYKGDGTTLANTTQVITSVYPEATRDWGRTSPWCTSMATDATGNLYLADYQTTRRIIKIDLSGNATTIVGAATQAQMDACTYEDGVSATTACLSQYCPSIAVGVDGSVYYTEYEHRWIRKVDSNGIVSTIPAPVYNRWPRPGPFGIAADDQGNVYFGMGRYHGVVASPPISGVVYKIDPSGHISEVAGDMGNPWEDPVADGSSAHNAYLMGPAALAVAKDGSLYIADELDIILPGLALRGHRIWKADADGSISLVVGRGTNSAYDDLLAVEGLPAADVLVGGAYSLATDKTGNLYVSDGYIIWQLTPFGRLVRIAGKGTCATAQDGRPAKDSPICASGMVVDPRGNLIFTSWSAWPWTVDGLKKVIVSEALVGNEADPGWLFTERGKGYVLSPTGLHLKTVDLDTGAIIRRFSYDGTGRLTSVRDGFDNQVTLHRDYEGRISSIESPDGKTTLLDVNAYGTLNRVVYADGSSYEFVYDTGGLMIETVDPSSNHFRRQFSNDGRLTDAFDPTGGHWSYTCSVNDGWVITNTLQTAEGDLFSFRGLTDEFGKYTLRTTFPQGDTTNSTESTDRRDYTYEGACGMRWVIDRNIDSRFGYLFNERSTAETPSGLRRTLTSGREYRDRDGNGAPDLILDIETINGRAWLSSKDLTSGTLTDTTPAGRSSTLSYDPVSFLARELSVPGLLPLRYSYDHGGRLTGATVGNRTSTLSYDERGELNALITSDNKSITYTHDVMGRLTAQQLPDGSTINYQYDANGNLTVLTNPNDLAYTLDYTANNQRQNFVQLLSGTTNYLYDKDRRLKTVTLPSGEIIANTYVNGNLATTTTPEGTASYDYLCGSRLGSVGKNGESVALGYDGALITSDSRGGTLAQSIAYAYNNDFAVTSLEYAGTTDNLGYDSDGLLTSAAGYSIGRNTQNGLAEGINGFGLTQTRTFNGYSEQDGMASSVAGVVGAYVWSATARDNAGRILRREEQIGGGTEVWEYTYDAVGRLSQVKKDSVEVESYTYDPNGNRLTETNSLRGILTRSFDYSIEDHVLTAGADSYEFNVDGFLQSKTTVAGTTSYSYSTRGELLAVWLPDGNILSYINDPFGRRIAKQFNGTTVEKYLWVGQTTLLAVYDGNDNLLQRFAYADARMPVSMTAGGATYFLLTDQVGTLRAVADTSGAIVKKIDYDSFGNIIADSNPAFSVPFGFAGGLHDRDTGLVRFGYRDYSPELGRFTAKDPLDFGGGDTNLYAYVLNDPVNLVDPTGEFPILLPVVLAVLGTWLSSSDANAPESPATELFPPQSTLDAGLAAAGGACYGVGPEVSIGSNLRFAPLGNRTRSLTGQLPHYHRRILDPSGNTIPGGGIGWHRPWQRGF